MQGSRDRQLLWLRSSEVCRGTVQCSNSFSCWGPAAGLNLSPPCLHAALQPVQGEEEGWPGWPPPGGL